MSRTDCIENVVLEGKAFKYFNVREKLKNIKNFDTLPFSLKILLESYVVNQEHQKINSVVHNNNNYFGWIPSRVLFQDYMGLPTLINILSLCDVDNKFLLCSELDFTLDSFLQIDSIQNLEHQLKLDMIGLKNGLRSGTNSTLTVNSSSRRSSHSSAHSFNSKKLGYFSNPNYMAVQPTFAAINSQGWLMVYPPAFYQPYNNNYNPNIPLPMFQPPCGYHGYGGETYLPAVIAVVPSPLAFPTQPPYPINPLKLADESFTTDDYIKQEFPTISEINGPPHRIAKSSFKPTPSQKRNGSNVSEKLNDCDTNLKRFVETCYCFGKKYDANILNDRFAKNKMSVAVEKVHENNGVDEIIYDLTIFQSAYQNNNLTKMINDNDDGNSCCIICDAPPASTHSKRHIVMCPAHNLPTENAETILRAHVLEFERNREQLTFLKWFSQTAFPNVRITPPGSSQSQSLSLEFLARFIVKTAAQYARKRVEKTNEETPMMIRLDNLCGTDIHIPMINGLGILSYCTSGIECQNVMLGHSIPFPTSYNFGTLDNNNQNELILQDSIVGVRLDFSNKDKPFNQYVTTTDIVLHITKALRNASEDIRGRICEFYGPGLVHLTIPERLAIANMYGEYGAVLAYFPFDNTTFEYILALNTHTSNPDCSLDEIHFIKHYYKVCGLYYDPSVEAHKEPLYKKVIDIDLSQVNTYLSGPHKASEKLAFHGSLLPNSADFTNANCETTQQEQEKSILPKINGHIALASITSCNNATNGSVMLAAGLLAKSALEKGLLRKHIAENSTIELRLEPGISGYWCLAESLTLPYLTKLGFDITGFGCRQCQHQSQIDHQTNNLNNVNFATTDNNYHLNESLAQLNLNTNIDNDVHRLMDAWRSKLDGYSTINNSLISHLKDNVGLDIYGVISNNRNFEGRTKPHPKSTYLCSPLLVIAYALAGNIYHDFEKQPLNSKDLRKGKEINNVATNQNDVSNSSDCIYLADIWPSREQIKRLENTIVMPALYDSLRKRIREGGNEDWRELRVNSLNFNSENFNHSSTCISYPWNRYSTCLKPNPSFMNAGANKLKENYSVIAVFGDNVSTDHISPAGSIARQSCAAQYLMAQGLKPREFNSYGSRRGNYEVMLRGIFANPRLINLLVDRNVVSPKVPLNYTRAPTMINVDRDDNKFSDGVNEYKRTNNRKDGEQYVSIYEACSTYHNYNDQRSGNFIIMAGHNFGTGSSRDWAVRGPRMLGINVIVANSFDPSYRAQCVYEGIYPFTSTQELGYDKTKILNVLHNKKAGYTKRSTGVGEITWIIKRKEITTETRNAHFTTCPTYIFEAVWLKNANTSQMDSNSLNLPLYSFEAKLQVFDEEEWLLLSHGGTLAYKLMMAQKNLNME